MLSCVKKNVFALEDVAYAIMETNGKMSVIKTPNKETPTAGMLGVALPDTGIEAVVVSDGVISDFFACAHSQEQGLGRGHLEG